VKVSTCLWFGKDIEEAVRFYVSLLPDSEIKHVLHSPGPWPGGDVGDVILVTFSLNGQNYQALNGGTPANYGTAASIAVECSDQMEVDRLWAALTEASGGVWGGCVYDAEMIVAQLARGALMEDHGTVQQSEEEV